MFVNQKKSRAREIIYGINAALTAIETTPEKITAAWVVKGREDDKRIRQIEQKLQAVGIRAQVAMRHSLDEKTDNGVHQGIVLEVIATPPKDERFLEELLEKLEDEKQLFLILDGVTDPRNLGAAMRSAWAAGADAVIVPKDKSASLTPVARKTADGAAEQVPFVAVTNLARTIEMMHGRQDLSGPHPEQHLRGSSAYADRLPGEPPAGRWLCDHPQGAAALHGRPGGYGAHPQEGLSLSFSTKHS